MLLEEFAPFIVQQGAVGLDSIVDLNPRCAVFVLGVDRSLEEVQSHQCGFTTLPGKGNLGDTLGFNVLAREGFEDIVRHEEVALWIKVFLLQKETILTIKIADSPSGFGHNVKCGRSIHCKSSILGNLVHFLQLN